MHKKIKGLPDYIIYDSGIIVSFKNKKYPIILKPMQKGIKTSSVNLYKDGIRYGFCLERLLYSHFGILKDEYDLQPYEIHLNEIIFNHYKVKQ